MTGHASGATSPRSTASWIASPQLAGFNFPHRFVRGVLHHLVEDRERVDRPIVHRSDTVEEALRPYQHSLAALFRQSDRVRHDRDGNMLRQLGNGVEGSSSTKRSTTASACALIASRCGWRAFGVRGRTSTSRSASCSAPSLHNVLPRSTWFISSFIMTPKREGTIPSPRGRAGRRRTGSARTSRIPKPDSRTRVAQQPVAKPRIKQRFVVIRVEIQLGRRAEMASGHIVEPHTQDGETQLRIDDVSMPCGSSPKSKGRRCETTPARTPLPPT